MTTGPAFIYVFPYLDAGLMWRKVVVGFVSWLRCRHMGGCRGSAVMPLHGRVRACAAGPIDFGGFVPIRPTLFLACRASAKAAGSSAV